MAFESLYIGTQAMRAAQGALSVTGHNIANLNTEGYTRQRANLETNVPLDLFPGQRGTGVHLEEVERMTDDFTRLQLELENQKLGEYSIKSDLLREIEEVLKEPGDGGLQKSVSDFFHAFHTLANAPEDLSTRNIVVEKANSLTTKLNSLSTQLKAIQTQADEYVLLKVKEVNEISSNIATLNNRIASVEAAEGQNANDLRDARELLVRQLNKIVNVTTYEDESHNLFVEANGSVLVAATHSIDIGSVRNAQGYLVPANEKTGEPITVLSGEFKGIMSARDDYLNDILGSLDTLSSKLVEEVNRIHSQGTAYQGMELMVGNVSVNQPALNMVNAGFTFVPQRGSFYISAMNSSTGVYEEHEIQVDPYANSVNDIINSINTAFNSGAVTASLTGSNQLQIEAGTGYKFYFVEGSTGNSDSSDFLLATGMNTFFKGNSAFTIAVKDEIKANPNLINAGQSLSPGDNKNALALADLENALLMDNGQYTFSDYYSSLISEAGQDAQVAVQDEENQDALVRLLEQRLTSTTGVSIEEEAANLLIYQRMFQAAAKYVQVMDTVLETLISGI